MNRGKIPGFYFDEERKRYFRIQANHLVPEGAKHSEGHVKLEKRKAKKRKLEAQRQAERNLNTVKRNPTLQNAITGGAGLHREHGRVAPSSSRDQQDAAIISQFRPKTVKVQLPGSATCPHIHLTSATYVPSTQQMVTASSHSHTGVSALHVCKWNWNKSRFEMPQGCGFAAFHSSISCVSVATYGDMPRAVACSQQDASTGQLFISRIPPPGSEPTFPYQSPGVYFHVKSGADNRLITSINPTTGITAVSTSKTVYIINEDSMATVSNSLLHDNEEYRLAIDWLDANIVTYEANYPESSNHYVKLWDIRTAKGVVSRFKVRNRITGILNPCKAASNHDVIGHQLLASTNHRINLYDTRMPQNSHAKDDLPLLSFPHTHQGPALDFTTDGRDLIAAVDRDNVVQIFSMKCGRRMTSLAMPGSDSNAEGSSIMKKLQWYDDPEVGSALQACMGNEVVRWTWGGRDRGDDDG